MCVAPTGIYTLTYYTHRLPERLSGRPHPAWPGEVTILSRGLYRVCVCLGHKARTMWPWAAAAAAGRGGSAVAESE